jgi:hypothetical protein
MLPVLNSCLEQKQVLAGRCHGLTQDPLTHTLYTLQAVFGSAWIYKYIIAGCRIRIGILNGDPNLRKPICRPEGKKLSFDDLDAPREGVLLMLVLEVFMEI